MVPVSLPDRAGAGDGCFLDRPDEVGAYGRDQAVSRRFLAQRSSGAGRVTRVGRSCRYPRA